MTEPVVLVEKKTDWAVVTLNRPQVFNALSLEVIKELKHVFRELKADDSIAAVILTGAGKAFCAGLDLKELAMGGLAALTDNSDGDLGAIITSFDRPIIGAINGVAATGGFEVALMCDLLIATPEATFIDSHARVGLVSGWGLSQRLQRIIGVNRAREYHFTGNPLTADKAEAWGLVNRVVKAEQLIPSCEKLAADMATCDRAALAGLKRVINKGGAMTLASALPYENQAMHEHAKNVSAETLKSNIEKALARGRQGKSN